MTNTLNEFILRLQTQKRYSKYTVRNYKKSIEEWFEFLEENDLDNPSSANRKTAKRYVAELSNALETTTVRNKISAIRSFYKFLIQTNSADSDPFSTVKLPKMKKSLPVFLTETQIPQLLQAPWENQNQTELSTLRTALALELLYGAGLRISELCTLKWKDIDLSSSSFCSSSSLVK